MDRSLRLLGTAASAVALGVLAGCGAVPADVDGTLERVRADGELRVGVTSNVPWTDTSSAEPTGTEVDLIEEFARRHGADVAWTEGSEATLADSLKGGVIDVAIGGFTDDTPWTDKAAVTDAYAEVTASDGSVEKHVMLTRAGENRLLVELETYLREEGPRP